MIPTDCLSYAKDIQDNLAALRYTRIKKAVIPNAIYFTHFVVPAAFVGTHIAKHGWMKVAQEVYSFVPSIGISGIFAGAILGANELFGTRTITKRILPFFLFGSAYLYHKWADTIQGVFLSYYKMCEKDLVLQLETNRKGLIKDLRRHFDSQAGILEQESRGTAKFLDRHQF